jgi:hypothetical protein
MQVVIQRFPRQNGDKQPMFVDVVQNVYGPNGSIPSAVRAYLVEDEIAQIGAEDMNWSVFLSRAVEPTFKFFVGFMHGQFGAMIDERRDDPFNGIRPRIVQRTVKVVDSVSHQNSKIIECRRICELMYKSFCTELRMYLNPGGITFMKRENACFDITDMSVGPLNL